MLNCNPGIVQSYFYNLKVGVIFIGSGVKFARKKLKLSNIDRLFALMIFAEIAGRFI